MTAGGRPESGQTSVYDGISRYPSLKTMPKSIFDTCLLLPLQYLQNVSQGGVCDGDSSEVEEAMKLQLTDRLLKSETAMWIW